MGNRKRGPAAPTKPLRSAHYLRRSGDMGIPKLHVAVSVVTSAQTEPKKGRRQELRLERVSARAFAVPQSGNALEADVVFHKAESFWFWLENQLVKHRCTWVWQLGACSGLTVLGFWELLETGRWRLDGADPCAKTDPNAPACNGWEGLCVLEDPPTIVLARPSNRRGMCKFVDLRNFGVDSWDELEGDVTVSGRRTSHADAAKRGPGRLASTRCAFVANWVDDWCRTIQDLDLGGLRHTSSAQAWHGWRHGYLRCPVLVHADEYALALERQSLHAGRCEAFRLGLIDGPIYHLDASSHYPACAISGPLPARFQKTLRCTTADAKKAAEDGWCVLTRAVVRQSVPVLPRRHGDITVFPTGGAVGVYCWPELQHAMRFGCEVDAWMMGLYEPGDLFGPFVCSLWEEKEAAEQAGAWGRRNCIKRLLNSAIGKCAQTGWGWKDCPGYLLNDAFETWQGVSPDTGKPCRWRSIAWHTQYECSTGEPPDSIPIVASWVYALGRIRLHKWIDVAGRENVYYVDTDSLFVNREGYDRLKAEGEVGANGIGALRLKSIHDWLDVRGFKHYVTESGITCCGLPRGALLSELSGWSFWTSETMKESIRLKRAPRPVLNGGMMPTGREYRHGTVGVDGRVVPLEF